MKLNDLEKIDFSDNSRLTFEHDLSRLNWFNIGGKTQIYLFVNSLRDLSKFLKIYQKTFSQKNKTNKTLKIIIIKLKIS